MLKAIAVDINTSCQLSCPHCYLPTNRPHQVALPWLIETMVKSDAEEVVIVGMEPFFNESSIEYVQSLVNQHPKVSVITNGINIHKTSVFLSLLNNVDISMDSGPKYWEASGYGRGTTGAPPFKEWSKNIRKMRSGMSSLCVLNTLFAANCTTKKIEDMIEGARAIDANHIMFSIYVRTERSLRATPVSLERVLEALSMSDIFCNDNKAYLLIDRYHLDSEGLSLEEAKDMIDTKSLQQKVELLEVYPHNMGIARLNAKGFVQAANDALWGQFGPNPNGMQLKPGEIITEDLLKKILKLFPYKSL